MCAFVSRLIRMYPPCILENMRPTIKPFNLKLLQNCSIEYVIVYFYNTVIRHAVTNHYSVV